MLFLLKRHWTSGLLGLAILALLGIALRSLFHDGPPVTPTLTAALLGAAAFAVVVSSDVALHGLFLVVFGAPYRRRHRELTEVFRTQSIAAILVGAAMAGLGEELVFRGLAIGPIYLVAAAILFGLLHHIRRSLWPFTLWAMWQGLLLAGAVFLTGDLFVSMVAHFLHDLTGFLIFRYLNRRVAKPTEGSPWA
jgi:membrane protease YdiL (CAAX protease family)